MASSQIMKGTTTRTESQGYEYTPDLDPVHGLDAFLERSGQKPWDLFQRNGGLLTSRLIFHDRKFGTQVWMLDHSPVVDHCNTASVWSAWNADASRLYVSGRRPLGDELHAGWVFNSDFSRLLPSPGGSLPIWDPKNPDIYFIHSAGQLIRGNARTGKTKILAKWNAFPRERVYGLTRDNQYVFLDTPNGGIWVNYTPGERPILQLGLHDGRPEAPGPIRTSLNPQDWGFQPDNTILIADRNCVTETKEWGHLFRLRIGLLIHRETGAMDHVIAPVSGQEEYLRTYISNRVEFPTGPNWKGYRKHESEDLDKLFQIYRYYPAMTHGHELSSPDGEYMVKDGIPTRIIRTRDGHTENFRLSPNGSHYHAHWVRNPRFFIGWVRGWKFGDFRRPESANVEFQIFTDKTFQPIVDTKHRFNGYYSGGDFSMLSPDQTKIHYGSSMTGRFKNYVAVMARPRSPQAIQWHPEAGDVVLTWKPPRYCREIQGYLIYRSEKSGDGYKCLTSNPVKDTCWRDNSVQPGQTYFYVVTSLEQVGLESGYSEEAALAGIDLPGCHNQSLVVYSEAETPLRDLGITDFPGLSVGVDRIGASDWYYLYRHPKSDKGETVLSIKIPASGYYHFWARVRSSQIGNTCWELKIDGTFLKIKTDKIKWTWVCVGTDPINLKSGEKNVKLATKDKNAQIDLICLATDNTFYPEGPRPENCIPPAMISELKAENVRERANRLTWKGPSDTGLSHFNVYASRKPINQLTQEYMVGSPTSEEFVDWGLRGNTLYYYMVTTVDRLGNESLPAQAQAMTLGLKGPPVEISLNFSEAELSGPFEHSDGVSIRGKTYVVPKDPENNKATWEFSVSREGSFYFWLRYLHRGSGQRGGEVYQDVRVLLDGKKVATLGGGLTDLQVPDDSIAASHSVAPYLWTWAWPGEAEFFPVHFLEGNHTLVLENLAPNVRYDMLTIVDDPTFIPPDGRLRQR